MSYQLIPNILLVGSLVGIVFMILRHLPEAAAQRDMPEHPLAHKLTLKGLPWLDIPKYSTYVKKQIQRLWHFLLEAKDLRPTAVVGYRVKKIFGRQAVSASQPAAITPLASPIPAAKEPDEEYYLAKIKADPKNLQLYNELGKYYLDAGLAADARDIFTYLVGHNMTNAEYYSRLAQAHYKLKNYSQAVENYTHSLKIDPAQPNRLYNKAICQEAMENYEDAVETFKTAISLEPRNIKFYITLSQTFLKMGDRVAARAILTKAHKFEPLNEDIAEKLKNV